MQNIIHAKRAIEEAQTIVIACHINPDGDTIGSLLSLGLGLQKMGKKVFLLSQDGVPKKYVTLPGADLIHKSWKKEYGSLQKLDLAISVDCSTRELLGKSYDVFRFAKKIIEIDHHEFRRPFGDIALIDENAAAVGEIIYDLLHCMKIPIGTAIAQNILTSIVVETNSFRLPNVRPKTFDICSSLMKVGVDFYHLSELVYWSKSKEAEILIGLCISRCEFLCKGKIVWSIIRTSDFSKVKGKDEDVDSVASDMLAIKGVAVSVFFREKTQSVYRVSLRSKGAVNVARIAEKFGGGGHFDVAGCILKNHDEEIKKMLDAISQVVMEHESKVKILQ